MMEPGSEECHWFASDLYKNGNPWGYETPVVSHSKYHSVLYESPASGTSPPKPHVSKHILWDDDHVRLPYAEQNLFPVKGESTDVLKPRWEIIQCSLLQPIASSRELEVAINTYNNNLPKFLALHYFFEELLDEEDSARFFENILPGIINLALQLPDIVPTNIPLLKQGSPKSLSLSQLQVSCLLANAFLCTFPWRKETAASYPGVDFVRLFAAHSRPKRVNCVAEKLKCVINYFRRILKAPVGVITFERKHVSKSHMPRWDTLQSELTETKVHITSFGTIESEGIGCLQVDFANKFVGGGVLGYGCVQEEIRYIICPELIVSRLFVAELAPNEALEITGVERYNNYSGYGDTFTWEGNYVDDTPFDNNYRRRTTIVAIDATRFSRPSDQYFPSAILRELNKAYVGFHSRVNAELPPVATGNWGCGAFRGDTKLKFLIQLMACTAAKRSMIYFTFGDVELLEDLQKMYTFLTEQKIIINQLWRYLCRFAKARIPSTELTAFIWQAHIDFINKPEATDSLDETKTSNEPSTSHFKGHLHIAAKKMNERKERVNKATSLPNDDTVINIDSIFTEDNEEAMEIEEIDKCAGNPKANYLPLDIKIGNPSKTQEESKECNKSDAGANDGEMGSTSTNPFRKSTSVPKKKITDYFDRINK